MTIPFGRATRVEVIMEFSTMGEVQVTARIENLGDLHLADQGTMAESDVRVVEVEDALVDTGATGLSMPKRLIAELGLKPLRKRQARTSEGIVTVQMYGTARLTIQGRECPTDVTELPDECPVLIGQVPLEVLDFVVDTPNHRLIGNPAHGGEHIIDLY
jgi:clan AA aspartic protease